MNADGGSGNSGEKRKQKVGHRRARSNTDTVTSPPVPLPVLGPVLVPAAPNPKNEVG